MADVALEGFQNLVDQLIADVGEVKSSIGDVKTELNALRGHMISLQQDVHNIYGILARHDSHLERIESRLEISEAPNLI